MSKEITKCSLAGFKYACAHERVHRYERKSVCVCVCIVCIGGGELNKSPCCHGVHKNKWQGGGSGEKRLVQMNKLGIMVYQESYVFIILSKTTTI